ncbi:MAG TPA: nucleoside hydrolase [Jiangellaceae bacterium]|nr:nucleoside hydrolase [Jiangellaceae bacterium]
MSRRIVAVVDTGVDDALALVVAVRHPALDLRGVVCTAGNVPLTRVLANTRYVLDLLGATVPIAAGAERRMDGERFGDRSVHGPDGLAGLGPAGEPAPDPVVRPDKSNATGQRVVRPDTSEIVTPEDVVVSLAPLTPLVGVPAGRIVAAYARPGQANYEMDPVAAALVDVEHLDVPDHAVEISHGETPVGELVAGLVRHQVGRGAGLGDAAVMLALAEPRLDPREWAGRVHDLAAARD